MVALDHVLHFMWGKGLDDFLPATDTSALTKPLSARPTLVLFQDEGSTGFSLQWFLLGHLKLRMASIRDVYHREWNDIKLALKSCKL
eukprot:2234602-Prorocentrum_lima.AAC.1